MLPPEAGAAKGICGKLIYWLYGMRPAAAAWEKHYSHKFESVGFKEGIACGEVFYHEERDLSLVVHGDDFTFCGMEVDLKWIRDLTKSRFEVKVRAMLGMDKRDDKKITILGRIVRWTRKGIEYEADPRHRTKVMEYFGFNNESKGIMCNGEREQKEE